jgi:hypothetical protein
VNLCCNQLGCRRCLALRPVGVAPGGAGIRNLRWQVERAFGRNSLLPMYDDVVSEDFVVVWKDYILTARAWSGPVSPAREKEGAHIEADIVP